MGPRCRQPPPPLPLHPLLPLPPHPPLPLPPPLPPPGLQRWAGLLTVIVRWTCGAAMYWALPAWLASITQLPTAPKVTVFPDREHTPGPLDEATEKTTGLPEPPPVA